MNIKKVLLTIMLAICFASIVASVIVYSQMPRSGEERQIYVFMSGSMEPTIMKGGFVMVDKTVRPSEIVAAPKPDGDIIVFFNPAKAYNDPNDIIIHRAVDKSFRDGKWYFTTQGDANPGPDSRQVPEDYLIGKVVNVNLQPTLLMWTVSLLVTIAVAIATGVLSLVLFVLIQTKKKVGKSISYPAKPPQIVRVCPKCGRVLTEEAKFCPNCGKELKDK